ncbi:hypothetical protein RclHR1_01930006 [Rhizophagus clarus]|uniref:DUF1769-domain-containing protein n=1 Tax=Rhizophagus clarus TaxID=94130 RepID=A0A2Z6R2K8_9GLOM|nr:hypothetical protein RclHR1_01930006 [Rhizophagus clarus]GES87063.1 DUF1769-domain-containing protein [Rhizophagus clarus]
MNKDQLKLQISVGSSYNPEQHVIILPNDDSHPFFINTSHFTGRICIRIKDFKGVTPQGTTRIESSPYFEGYNVKYSIQVQGRFKGNNLTADDIFFGNDFDKKINLPFGSSLGLKILQFIDPGLQADIYSDKPWAYSPLVYTMNKINLYEEPIIEDDKWLPSWPSPYGEHIEENVICSSEGVEFKDVSKRKKYFVDKSNRKRFQIKENQIWNFDFFNSYIDFNDVAVTLPGFKLGVLQYWDGQPVRYVCKTRDSSNVFFVILFQLVLVKEEDDDNAIAMSKSKDIIEGSNGNDVGEILPLENHPDIVNFTPKTGARWASQKSPTSLFPFTKSKKDVILSPSPMSLSPSALNDSNEFNAAFEKNDTEGDVED